MRLLICVCVCHFRLAVGVKKLLEIVEVSSQVKCVLDVGAHVDIAFNVPAYCTLLSNQS